MKVRSIIVLCLWMASLVAPFLPLQAEMCAVTCCMNPITACSTEGINEDCTGMADATRLHPIPAAPINAVHGKAIQATAAASLTMPLELALAHPAIHARSLPLRLPPPPTHLLI